MAVVWGAGQDGDGPTTIVQLDGQGRQMDPADRQCWQRQRKSIVFTTMCALHVGSCAQQ
jgi:hypothetical protein